MSAAAAAAAAWFCLFVSPWHHLMQPAVTLMRYFYVCIRAVRVTGTGKVRSANSTI